MRIPVFIAVALIAASTQVMAETPWEAYLKAPSPATAATVKTAEYSVPDESGAKFEADLSVLEYEVAAGDVESTKLAVRLLVQFDNAAAISEFLTAIIGRSIRTNPAGYLQAVQQSKFCHGAFPSGDLFTDRDEARKVEARARVEALRSVKIPALKAKRDECVASLGDFGK